MSHYFQTPSGTEKRFTVPMRLLGHDVELESARGVFSGDGLDAGTAVLLRTVEPPTGAVRVLDLGCGIGPITVALGLASPEARITAVDVNERALALTASNAARTSIADRVTVVHPDDVPAELAFDQIWSNPPIRIGKAALHALLEQWLPRLTPAGVAYLVVARNLGADSLAVWIEQNGWGCSRLASAKGFRVLAVTRTV